MNKKERYDISIKVNKVSNDTKIWIIFIVGILIAVFSYPHNIVHWIGILMLAVSVFNGGKAYGHKMGFFYEELEK